MKCFLVVLVLGGNCIATTNAFATTTTTTTTTRSAMKQNRQRTKKLSLAGEKSETAAGESLYDLYNQQISNEFHASHLYLAAAIEADKKDLVGMANYFKNESDEERSHALQLIDFACKRNFPITLESFPAPPHKFTTTYELWETLLEAEQNNTKALQKLADAAMEAHDHAILAFLQPFHMEQVEAEDQLGTILAKIKDEQETPGLLRLLDQELSQSSAKHVA